MNKKYLKYIKEHRDNIKKACDFWYEEWQRMYPHSYKNEKDKKQLKKVLNRIKLTHDLSKYSKTEFKPYAENFFGERVCNKCEYFMNCDYGHIGLGLGSWAKECKDYKYKGFDLAWEHHFRNNKHHWNYWIYDWDKYDNEPESPQLKYCELKEPYIMPERYLIEMICDWTAMSYKFGDTPQDFYLKNYNKIKLNRQTRFSLEVKLGLLFYSAPICEGNEEYWMTIQELKEQGCNLNELLSSVCKKYNIDFNQYDI